MSVGLSVHYIETHKGIVGSGTQVQRKHWGVAYKSFGRVLGFYIHKMKVNNFYTQSNMKDCFSVWFSNDIVYILESSTKYLGDSIESKYKHLRSVYSCRT